MKETRGFLARIASEKQSKKPNPPRREFARSNARKYAEAALRNLHAEVSTTAEGTRACTLFRASARLGKFVGAGILAESEVYLSMTEAGRQCGLPQWEIERDVTNGIARGRTTPDYGPTA